MGSCLVGEAERVWVYLVYTIYHRVVTLAEEAIRWQMQCLSRSLVLSLFQSLIFSVSVCQDCCSLQLFPLFSLGIMRQCRCCRFSWSNSWSVQTEFTHSLLFFEGRPQTFPLNVCSHVLSCFPFMNFDDCWGSWEFKQAKKKKKCKREGHILFNTLY